MNPMNREADRWTFQADASIIRASASASDRLTIGTTCVIRPLLRKAKCECSAALEASSHTRRASFREGYIIVSGIFRPDNRRASARAPSVPESPRGDALLKVPRSRNPDGGALLCCAHPTAAELASGARMRPRHRSVVRQPKLVRAPSVVYVLRHRPREVGRRTSRSFGSPAGRPRNPHETWC